MSLGWVLQSTQARTRGGCLQGGSSPVSPAPRPAPSSSGTSSHSTTPPLALYRREPPSAKPSPTLPHTTGPPSSLPAPTLQGHQLPSLPPGHRAACRVHKNCAPPAPNAVTLNTSNTCSCSTTQNKVEKYILKHCFTSQSKNGQRLKIQFSRPFWSHLQISYDPDKEG